MKRRAPAFGLALALAATARVAAQTPEPTPSPGPTASAQAPLPAPAPFPPAPSVTPSSAPSVTPTPANLPTTLPAPALAPLPTATPLYRFVYRPVAAPTPAPDPNTPQIAEIDLSDSTIVTPGDVHVRILTSYGVTNVTAQTLGRSIAIPRSAPGLFLLDTSIPGIPFFMSYLKNRVYPIVFVAGGPDGRTATITLSLTLK